MKKKYISIFAIYLIFHITINLMHPITSIYVESLKLDKAYFGLFFSMMSLGQVVGSLIWGSISDKIGRIKLISVGVIGYGLFQFLFGFVTYHPLLILGYRFLAGFFVSAPLTLLVTYLVDISDKEDRSKNIIGFTCLQILGSSIGYKIGGFLFTYFDISITELFILQIVFCVFISFITYILFKAKDKQFVSESTKKYSSFSQLKGIGKITTIFLITLTLVAIAQNNVSKYLDVYIVDINYSPDDLSNIVLISGILGVFANLFLIPFFKKRVKENYHIIFLITLVISVVTLTITFVGSKSNLMLYLYTFFMIYMMAKSVGTSMETAFFAKTAPEEKRGIFLGLRQSFISLGNVIGPLLGSVLYKDEHRLWVFYVSIVLLAIALLIMVFVTKIMKNNLKQTKNPS